MIIFSQENWFRDRYRLHFSLLSECFVRSICASSLACYHLSSCLRPIFHMWLTTQHWHSFSFMNTHLHISVSEPHHCFFQDCVFRALVSVTMSNGLKQQWVPEIWVCDSVNSPPIRSVIIFSSVVAMDTQVWATKNFAENCLLQRQW